MKFRYQAVELLVIAECTQLVTIAQNIIYNMSNSLAVPTQPALRHRLENSMCSETMQGVNACGRRFVPFDTFAGHRTHIGATHEEAGLHHESC